VNRSTSVLWLLVFAVAGGACAQSPSEPNSDQASIVEVIGCLSQTDAGWILAKATAPSVSPTSFTTPEAVKAAAEKPIGTDQYRLLGTSPFSPERHKGHKMVVRGLLIKSSKDPRINLTSFQMLAETCAK
jgi:hypothetical protein